MRMLHIKIVLREYMNIMSEKQKSIQLKFLNNRNRNRKQNYENQSNGMIKKKAEINELKTKIIYLYK